MTGANCTAQCLTREGPSASGMRGCLDPAAAIMELPLNGIAIDQSNACQVQAIYAEGHLNLTSVTPD